MNDHEAYSSQIQRFSYVSGVLLAFLCTLGNPCPIHAENSPKPTLEARAHRVNFAAIQRAVDDLSTRHPALQRQLKEPVAQLQAHSTDWPAVLKGLKHADPEAQAQATAVLSLKRQLLLSNPLLDFDRLLLVKRHAKKLGLPTNWQGNSDVPSKGYDNEIAVLSQVWGD
ncbi:MAG: hypothetical protein GY809_21510, partial [Planctomycetes bacterium]|nr:hypothetical protein [Planctomycetota bacterium]